MTFTPAHLVTPVVYVLYVAQYSGGYTNITNEKLYRHNLPLEYRNIHDYPRFIRRSCDIFQTPHCKSQVYYI